MICNVKRLRWRLFLDLLIPMGLLVSYFERLGVTTCMNAGYGSIGDFRHRLGPPFPYQGADCCAREENYISDCSMMPE